MTEKKEERYSEQEGILQVTKTVFGKESFTEERIPIHRFATQPAIVSVKAGATLGLKVKFEFGRIDVFLSIPCYKEEVDDIFPRVKDWVDERMTKEVAELKKEVG